ncbi:MAG: multicopper oxidase domain-containing protein, partial [Allorhizobium sp.]
DGHCFRLLHPFDDGWEPYFLDTVYLGPGQVHRIAFIADLVGRHALRSTIADHAETGVATHLEITS